MADITMEQGSPAAPSAPPEPAVPQPSAPSMPSAPKPRSEKTLKIVGGVIVILVIIGAVYFLISSGFFASSQSTTTTSTPGQLPQRIPIWITDPSHVPSGTQALIITYSSLMTHTPGSGWVNAQGNGVVNLTGVIGSGEILGFANVSNSNVDMLSFHISSAIIIVNGATYNLTLPNSTVTSQVSGSTSVASSDGILIDVAPNVTSSSGNNGYTMAVSSKFLILPTSEVQSSTQLINAAVGLNATVLAQLNGLI